jgi:hypothetical protein
LAWNANPTSTPAQTSVRRRRETAARTVRSAASSSSRIISVSGTFPRPSAIVAGQSTNAPAARIPASGPDSRRTTSYTTTTLAIPSITCGATSAHACTPNRRTDSAWTQNAPGSLSRLIVAAGSNAAEKKLCQLIDMLRTAAA